MTRLDRFFTTRRDRSQPLVLVTVVETRGSTYSKAGGHMLIDSAGEFCGMLSGGCLEGDLVERARQCMEKRQPQTVTYDLGADDELWGLGVGCDGSMRVLLLPMYPDSGYEPYASMSEVVSGDAAGSMAIVIDSESIHTDVGEAVVFHDDGVRSFCSRPEVGAAISAAVDSVEVPGVSHVAVPDGQLLVLFSRVLPPPSLLVLGAGLDSEPVVRIADELGWRCTVADHRPASIESRSYPESTRSLCCDVDDLSSRLELSAFDLAIVMSHHLGSDRGYLSQLADVDVGYVGLLGPAGRRDRLLAEIGDAAPKIEPRLYGPAGLKLGGTGPGAIALEIIAGMQAYLGDRSEVVGCIDIDRGSVEGD